MKMMMSENQSSKSQLHVTAFRVLRVKRQKASLNRQPSAYNCGGRGRLGSVADPHRKNADADPGKNLKVDVDPDAYPDSCPY
jgi:hypothetical protein